MWNKAEVGKELQKDNVLDSLVIALLILTPALGYKLSGPERIGSVAETLEYLRDIMDKGHVRIQRGGTGVRTPPEKSQKYRVS